ncbi:hypothetical protein NDU88_007466 [Pleurodeles waltl]|uniref:Uncharacterized protein n=1 Tax=Pleurodeles waltl TaxID=8319 RepID=A0AAV7PU45_PLEWA|nr:hypothetical protein NDU88_007466 [Pleurodeles waltl]
MASPSSQLQSKPFITCLYLHLLGVRGREPGEPFLGSNGEEEQGVGSSGRSAQSARLSLEERSRVFLLLFPGNRKRTWILPPTWCPQASDGSAGADSPFEVGPPRCFRVRVSDPRSAN